MELQVPADRLGRMLRAMFGPLSLPEKSPVETTWEDDGGALTVRCEGYTHEFVHAAT